jgi:hypothetical protein
MLERLNEEIKRDPRGPHLPEHRILSAPHPRTVRRDPRDLAGGQPLSEHDAPGGAEKGVVETGRLKRPNAVGAAPGYALRAANSANRINRLPDHEFAQLDAHNSSHPAVSNGAYTGGEKFAATEKHP